MVVLIIQVEHFLQIHGKAQLMQIDMQEAEHLYLIAQIEHFILQEYRWK